MLWKFGEKTSKTCIGVPLGDGQYCVMLCTDGILFIAFLNNSIYTFECGLIKCLKATVTEYVFSQCVTLRYISCGAIVTISCFDFFVNTLLHSENPSLEYLIVATQGSRLHGYKLLI